MPVLDLDSDSNLNLRGRNFIMADIIGLTCTQCKRRNYTTTVNKKKQAKKLELKKYCKWCNAPTVHKESK